MEVYIINSAARSYILNIKIRPLVTEFALMIKLVGGIPPTRLILMYDYYICSHVVKFLMRFEIVSEETYYLKRITYRFWKWFNLWNVFYYALQCRADPTFCVVFKRFAYESNMFSKLFDIFPFKAYFKMYTIYWKT